MDANEVQERARRVAIRHEPPTIDVGKEPFANYLPMR
jgi:hypothetical protein